MKQLISVSCDYFYAGCIIDQNYIVINAAPIIKWMIGKDIRNIYTQYKNKYNFNRVGSVYE